MRCRSRFVSAFQQTGYLINKILALTEFCDFKMAVIKCVVQFWSEIVLVISQSNLREITRMTRMISD